MIDKESVRNAALEEAAVTAWNVGMDVHNYGSTLSDPRYIGSKCAENIRALKTNPAQTDYKAVYQEWTDKTNFIQEWVSKGVISAKYLGWHRADVMRDLIENSGITSRSGND